MWITKKVKTINIILIIITCIIVSSLNCTSEGDFFIEVRSTSGEPVVGAYIRGGIDWDYFSAVTNDKGMALLPDYARGLWATIRKDNFYPIIIEHIGPGVYWLEHTPRSLELICEIEGDVIRFDADQIVTITYDGCYHVYAYDDNGVSEITASQLPGCVRFFKTYGDTLWLSTHGEGFYVYSLSNLQQPQQICHLNIPGYTIRPFAVKDTILATGLWGEGPLRFFSFNYDGQYLELASVGNFVIHEMTFISHYLIVIGHSVGSSDTPIIFDVQDPVQPQLIYTGSQTEPVSTFLYGNYLVLQPYLCTSGPTEYRLLNLNDPVNPQEVGPLYSDAYLCGVVNDSIAVGHTVMTTLLHGSLLSGFGTIATVAHGCLAGGFPPYFIIGYNLYKL